MPDGSWTLQPVAGDPFAAPQSAGAPPQAAPSWKLEPVEGDPFAAPAKKIPGLPTASVDKGDYQSDIDTGAPAKPTTQADPSIGLYPPGEKKRPQSATAAQAAAFARGAVTTTGTEMVSYAQAAQVAAQKMARNILGAADQIDAGKYRRADVPWPVGGRARPMSRPTSVRPPSSARRCAWTSTARSGRRNCAAECYVGGAGGAADRPGGRRPRRPALSARASRSPRSRKASARTSLARWVAWCRW